MNYKIFVFSDDDLKNIEFSYESLQNTLASFNISIEMFAILQHTQENISKVLEQNGNLILFCRNNDIDKMMIDNISKLSNDKNYINDQAVLFNKGDNKVLFIPYDSDWVDTIKKAKLNPHLPNKSCIFKLFGIPKDRVIERLESLNGEIENFKYSVIEKDLLVDVYAFYNGTDNFIDNEQVKIASLFTEFIYSENNLSLAQTICQLARLKDFKLSIFEGITNGEIIKNLCDNNENIKDILRSGSVGFLDRSLTPDNLYQHTINLFSNSQDNDFVINIQGQYEQGVLTCLYTIGTLKNLSLYKNIFKTNKDKALKIAVNAIMFNIVKKLRQNNLIN